MKKAQMQIHWIFVIAAGSIILLFFFGFGLKYKDLETTKLNVAIAKHIESSVLGLKTGEQFKTVKLNEKTKIEMDLLVKVPVKELEVFVNDIKVSEIPELSKSKKILIMAEASEFVSSDKIKLSIKFKDKQGKQQESINEYPIKILNVPWYVKLLAFLHLL